MGLLIRVENPTTEENRALIEESQSALKDIFCPQDVFTISAEELDTANTQFFVARLDGQAVGCVALVDLLGYGEVKRLYVQDSARKAGIGRALMEAVFHQALELGLTHIQLETGARLKDAVALYRSLGFMECAPFGGYRQNPSSLFMEYRIH